MRSRSTSRRNPHEKNSKRKKNSKKSSSRSHRRNEEKKIVNNKKTIEENVSVKSKESSFDPDEIMNLSNDESDNVEG